MIKTKLIYKAFIFFVLFAIQLPAFLCFAQDSDKNSEIIFTKEELSWMKKHPVVTLGFNDQMPPLLILDEEGNHTGIYPELFREINRLLPIAIKIEVGNWDTIVKKARKREIDGLVACVPSQAKASNLISTVPTHKNFPVLYAKQDAQFEINSLDDLKGKSVAYQQELKMFETVLEPYRDSCEIITFKSTTDALLAVLNGQADLAMGLGSHNYVLAKNLLSGLKIIFFDLEHKDFISSGIRDDWPELVNIMNKVLNHIGQVNIQQILERWVGISETIPLIILNTKEKEWLKEHPVINVGVDANLPPISYIDSEGNYQGFIIDYLISIENIINVKFKIVRENQLQPDIITYHSKNTKDNSEYSCTKEIIEMPTGIYVHEGVNYISNLNLLNGKNIAVVNGYGLSDYISTHHPEIIIYPVDNPLQGIQAVLNKKVFALIGNVVTTGHIINKLGYDNIDMAGEFPYTFTSCFNVRADKPQLNAILNKAIDAIPDSEHNALYNKWAPLTNEVRFNYSLLWKIGIGIFVIIILIIYWNRRLAIVVKKRTEEVIDREHKFRAVYEYSRDAIAIANEHNFVDCNMAALRMFGYSSKTEFCKNHPADVSPEKQPDGTSSYDKANQLYAIAIQGKGEIFEWVHTRKDGTNFPCEILISPLNWEGKNIFQAVIRDITERKKAEEALLDSERKLHAIFDHHFQLTGLLDREGRIIATNKTYLEFSGLNKSDVIGKYFWLGPLWSPGQEQEIQDAIVRASKGNFIRFETTHRRYDGEIRNIDFSLNPVLNNNGDLLYIVPEGRDITDIRHAEESLKRSEEKYRTFFMNSSDAMLMIRNNKFFDCNQAAVKILGYQDPKELFNLSPVEISPEYQPDGRSSSEKATEMIQTAYDKGSHRFEWLLLKKNGEEIPFEVSYTSMPEEFGNILHVILVDIKNRKNAELEIEKYQNHLERMVKLRTEELEIAIKDLKETQAQLIQSEKMASLGILTAGVAHEINNPLNFILGSYSGLKVILEEELKDNTQLKALLNNLKTGVDRVTIIINGLNQFSRNQKRFDETCNIHSILDNCLVMLNNQIIERIEVVKDYWQEPVESIGNVGKLHQAFINILTNSIQAIDSAGMIKIATKKTGNSIIIEITDTGSGISKENLSKITDPFFTTKDPGKGTGLGLSVTYTIIKQHKGKIDYTSELNNWTRVVISLPSK